MEVNVFHLFKRFEAGFFAQIDNIIVNQFLDLRCVAENRECTGDAVLGSVEFDILNIWYNYGHCARLEAFTVNKNLCYILAVDIHILDLLWSNVFALGKLENMLLAINNLQCSILNYFLK